MGIFVNANGTIKELKTVNVNVNGAIKSLSSVYANAGGIKKIFPLEAFKVLKGTLQSGGHNQAETATSLTNIAISKSCTAKIKVHIDAIGTGSNGTVRSVAIAGSENKSVELRTADGFSSSGANIDWYGETQLSPGAYSFSFFVFNVSASSAGVSYSTSTFTYEISFF
ncbi:MAG: hypothetical protein NC084_12505 [Bacteroides sp.]|nr:hypothetical protein [Eubacterium sp.]MCM1417726.1 hypothetical protein [Roseburia sp.]MCM1463514.1 hypothetical protein [Bacteroides sp.]